MKHKILTAILAHMVLGGIISAMGKDNDSKTPSTDDKNI